MAEGSVCSQTSQIRQPLWQASQSYHSKHSVWKALYGKNFGVRWPLKSLNEGH